MIKNLCSVAKGSLGQRNRCSFREYGHNCSRHYSGEWRYSNV